MRRARVLALLVAVMVLATSMGTADASAVEKKRRKPKATFANEYTQRVGKDGKPSKKLALAAFEAAFGAVPGVGGPALPTRGLSDGTTAANLAIANLDRLSTKQKRAIERRLLANAADAQVVPESAAPVGGRSARRGGALARLAMLRDRIAAQLRRPLGIELRYTEAGGPAGSPGAFGVDGWSLGVDASGTGLSFPPHGCLVSVAADRLRGRPRAYVESLEASLVMNCFTLTMASSLASIVSRLWATEGFSLWVGESFTGGTARSAAGWNQWLVDTQDSLFGYTAGGIGLFAYQEDFGSGLPFTAYPGVVRAANNRAAWAAYTITGNDGLIGMIAQARTRRPANGRQWTSRGPGITNPPSTLAEQRPGSSPSFRLGELGSAAFRVTGLDGDVLEVQVDAGSGGVYGWVGFAGHDDIELAGAGTVTKRICLRDDGCAPCPTQTFERGGHGEAVVALGNPGRSENSFVVHLEQRPLTEVCALPPPPPPSSVPPVVPGGATPSSSTPSVGGPTDTEAPAVSSITVDPHDVCNLVTVTAYITDNVGVTDALFVFEYGGSTHEGAMSNVGGSIWRGRLSTALGGNGAFNVPVDVHAGDAANNEGSSTTTVDIELC